MREMKTTMTPKMKEMMERQRSGKKAAMPLKHEMMIRREPNHNVHVITPHGKIHSGRKGRTV
ncbi:hypothetical protein KOM00_19900 [Geomonas sp. Red69]|uniref:Uncharacterized protein n=1 Tax=Geomonas diazotrophica TaxID=2843197 RepID=A0ABX8JJT2_9BACT|nr:MULTISPECIES: hypothetical protein [Geomonas]MBU5638988.1 hypothetical protein [Geomonas diazotrophica]QWV98241.1 hypothetical protein KP005_02815 [Geomonas nitrogeniifigens]QXE87425.1 hypothetical protein KP003_03180 [Geomonas nitrogeniifigens]